MTFTIHIKPGGFNLLVNSNETILHAAVRQNINFPHDYQNKFCQFCKGRLLEGQVAYENTILPGLTDDERDAGYALFCQAKPLTDLVIYLENVSSTSQFPLKKLTYNLQALKLLTPTIYQIILNPPENDFLQYQAGQYLEIIHRDASPKPFSIANAPNATDHAIELHIRHNKENPYTSALIHELQCCKTLRVHGPLGNCTLRYTPPLPLIFVAGGTGFAPIKALLEQLLCENFQQPVYFYWGAREAGDLYMHELVSQWQTQYNFFHYIPVLSSVKNAWQGRTGLVHEVVVQDHPELSRHHVYVSGPTELVYAAWRTFSARGLDRNFIYSDALDYLPAV